MDQRALGLAGGVIERARREHSFGVRFRNGFFNSSLMQGAAGVGYQLLRLAYPEKFPPVLLLE